MFRGPDGWLRPWLLDREGVRFKIAPALRLILVDGNAVVEAACAGFGIAQADDVICAAAAEALVPVLPEFAFLRPPVHALLPGEGHTIRSAKVRILLDHLVTVLRP